VPAVKFSQGQDFLWSRSLIFFTVFLVPAEAGSAKFARSTPFHNLLLFFFVFSDIFSIVPSRGVFEHSGNCPWQPLSCPKHVLNAVNFITLARGTNLFVFFFFFFPLPILVPSVKSFPGRSRAHWKGL